jgi:replicative DNA helicase
MIHDEQAEKAALGAMMQNKRSLAAGDGFPVSHFFTDTHRSIFATIRLLAEQGAEVNWLSVSQELERKGIKHVTYLMDLADGVPANFDASGSLARIREMAQLRSVITIAEAAMQRAQNHDDSGDILHELQAVALQQQAETSQVKPTHISELVVGFLDEMRHQRTRDTSIVGIPTGIAGLDEAMGGWRNGELTYVGALPGRGKTSFLLQAMYSAALAGYGVGCISLEMRAQQLMRRLAILHSNLHAYKFRDVKTMSETEYSDAKRAAAGLGDLPITINDQSGLRPAQIASLARQMHAMGAKAIFVDFVQVIHEDGKDRREAINRVSAALRDTCKALNIPFIVASQLARRDSDPNRRPTIQDLRESGNLEQDANNVLLLYRPKDKATSTWSGEDELILDKQREGVTGSILVRYDDKTLTYMGRQ